MILLKKIYLIRHGETTWNIDGRFQGKTDTELSEAGKKQAEFLAERVSDLKIDKIYSSELKRAYNTAEAIAEKMGLTVEVSPFLKEIDFAHWEGNTISEIQAKFPEEYKKCRQDPVKYGFRYGLPFEDVKNDINSFIESCILDSEEENIAVVSHNVILKMLVVVLLKFSDKTVRNLFLGNCSISEIHINEKGRVLVRYNDTAHIEFAEKNGLI